MVKEQLHAAGMVRSLRSRTAAKARQAWISSAVCSQELERISPMDIPAASYSNISETLIDIPRTHGLPLRVPGAIVIRKLSDVNNIAGIVGWACCRKPERRRSGATVLIVKGVFVC